MAGRARRRSQLVGEADGSLDAPRAKENEPGFHRPRHGERTRCSNPKNKPKGCNAFARRNSDPPACTTCGGGTRTSRQWNRDGDTGTVSKRDTGRINVPPRVAALLNGELDVADLDNEELARGYPRAADGSFRGAPEIIPRSMYNRMVRELFERANRELKTGLVDSAKFMIQLVQNKEADPAVRLKAAIWVFERLQGKTPDVSITTEIKKYETIFEGIDRDVIDAEVVDDGRTP